MPDSPPMDQVAGQLKAPCSQRPILDCLSSWACLLPLWVSHLLGLAPPPLGPSSPDGALVPARLNPALGLVRLALPPASLPGPGPSCGDCVTGAALPQLGSIAPRGSSLGLPSLGVVLPTHVLISCLHGSSRTADPGRGHTSSRSVCSQSLLTRHYPLPQAGLPSGPPSLPPPFLPSPALPNPLHWLGSASLT